MPSSGGNTSSALTTLCDAHDGLEHAASSDELRAQMQHFATHAGFAYVAYVLTINLPSLKAQRFIINGFPPEWMETYLSRNYFEVDPIIRHALGSALPVLWTDHHFRDSKSLEFWEEARTHGLQSGLSLSVHDRPGVTGVFSLAGDVFDLQGQALAALVGRAQMFANLLHQAVTRVAMPHLLPEQEIYLTRRELACLRWAAEGKTAWETGRILGITERTAVFHMNNAIKKLGATNKIQAIVRAVVLKLL